MLWIGFLGAASPLRALPSAKAVTQYGHDKWTAGRGLPGESVYQVLQTGDGYLWLRTSAGAVRFDGVRFAGMGAVAGGQWNAEGIKAMTLDHQGGLILRGTTRTLRYRDGAFAEALPPMPMPVGIVRVIHEGRDGTLWLGSDSSIYRVGRSAMEMVLDEVSWVYAFHEDAQGRIWIGCNHGLYCWDGARFTHHEPLFSTALGEDARGQMWLGSRDGLFPIRSDERDGSYRSPLSHESITAILADRDGNLWAGTDGAGLFRFDGTRWSSFTMGDGLSDNSVLALHEDREGSLWIGTKSGLDRLRDTRLTAFTVREGLAGHEAYSILAGRDGAAYVFCDGKGLTQIKEGRSRIFTRASGLPNNDGATMCPSRDGGVWIGTGGGLCRFKDGRIQAYPSDLFGAYISALIEDQDSLLVATADGRLHAFQQGQKVKLGIRSEEDASRPGLSDGTYVFRMHIDARGTLWMASSSGLYRCVRTSPRLFAARRVIEHEVMSIFDDQSGSLWLTGRTQGLIRMRLDDGSRTRYTARDGLPDDEITAVLGDDQGRLWMSTPGGIASVPIEDLEAYSAGRIQALDASGHGRVDLLVAGQAGLPERQPAAARMPDGRLWFTTRKGSVIVDPGKLRHNGCLPPVHIEALKVGPRSIVPESARTLGPGKIDLELRYTALSLSDPERVRFKYWLEGYDPGWIDAGNRRSAFYTKLPPGRYRFRVIACNDDGIWNESGATLDFQVSPRFYQTRWFLAMSLLALAGLGLGVHRLRTHRLRIHARNLSRIIGERTRTLEEQRAFLRQLLDINPNYVFVKDREGRFTVVNRAFGDAFRPSGESLSGGSEEELFDQVRELEAFRQGDAELLEGRPEINLEQILTDARGVRHWLQTAKRPILGPDGRVAQILTVSTDITQRKLAEEERERLILELKDALVKVRLLSGFLPICGSCKKIRNDHGYWEQIEAYIEDHSDAEFSHGICPECMGRFFPDYPGAGSEGAGSDGAGSDGIR